MLTKSVQWLECQLHWMTAPSNIKCTIVITGLSILEGAATHIHARFSALYQAPAGPCKLYPRPQAAERTTWYTLMHMRINLRGMSENSILLLPSAKWRH